MTRLASRHLTIGSHSAHFDLELAVVQIVVAGRTSLIGKMVLRRGSFGNRRGTVALHAGHRYVRAIQSKARRLVLREREFRGMESLDRVTVFATVLVRSGGELSAMIVHVAIQAAPKCDLELRGRACRRMARRAFHLGVFAEQRISGRGVLLHPVRRGLEAIDGVTGSALGPSGPFAKLPLVRIRLVAIHALRMRDRFLEVARGRMALGASD